MKRRLGRAPGGRSPKGAPDGALAQFPLLITVSRGSIKGPKGSMAPIMVPPPAVSESQRVTTKALEPRSGR